MKHDNDYYLREAAPVSAIAHMCVPLLAAMGVMTLASLVDAFFVGQLGDTAALAAVAGHGRQHVHRAFAGSG